MPAVRDRQADITLPEVPVARARRPVVLGTLALRPDPTAEQMAINSCLDSGSPLVIVNSVQLPPYPTTMMVGGLQAMVLPHEDDREAVSESADRIASLGVEVETVGLVTPRPVRALLDFAGRRSPGLLLFGPPLSENARLRMRMATRRIRREAPCLVSGAPDG
ncbi:MAG: hypothetical protein ACKOTH_06340 [Solirubrobacterales bacterium]